MILKPNKEAKQNNKFINMNCIYEMRIAPSCNICVDLPTGGTCIASYENEKQCEIAMNMFRKAIELEKPFFEFPDFKQIQGVVANSYQEKERHMSGKKTKGHGGS